MSASSTTTHPPPSTSELHATLSPAVIKDASPASSSEEGSKKRARSEVAADEPTAPATVDGGGDGKGPAKKKTKMTEAEMEERRKAKEAKEKEKEAKEKERAAKEEEKAVKKAERDEKKRIRDEEKKKKDEEKKKKDDEKKKKDEEKAKKDRAQTRLQNFFVKPSGPPSSPAKATAAPPGACPKTMSPELEIRQRQSDYEKSFQPFFVKPNVTVAPPHCFQRDDAYKFAMKVSIDKALTLPREHNCAENQMETVPAVGTVTKEQITELLHIPPHKRGPRGKMLGYTTKDLLARINAPDDSSLPPIIELKKQKIPKGADGTAIYFKMLNCLPNKFLKFAEDVRPPYSGTFTRNPTTGGLRKGRNPFQKTLPNINYDYDSEAEWEEGAQDEDGEDLLSDDGEEDEEVESLDDEMDGFLDDEEDQAAKNRRGALAALVPLSSGLCWEDEDGRNTRVEFEEMKMEVLLEGVSGPIDPFSTVYWNPPPKNAKTLTSFLVSASAPKSSVPKPCTSKASVPTAMEPPPLPLATSNRPQVTTVAIGAEALTPKKGKSVLLVPAEDLDDFKRAVEGSDMTKAGLIEVLKKQFPKIGKESIKQTLNRVAARVGDRERDKRWVLI
ncbi:hypothetical protein P167DRAFT_608689 [Morchella conica CCBAS932]|uniref:Chromatin assembly factor 1 subunit A n=1 Tax=Morchella conica CCBAS932 TaxID=1392247 RepID=A0A3N4KGG6_9PEZI|nr:hypothetical protein P167DRAFT_608689 [Morchella conica CCBAS932]